MSKLIYRSWSQRFLIFLGGVLLSCQQATPALAKLSVEEINSIARQTTVLIAPGLTPELIQEIEADRNNPLAKGKRDKVWYAGSGVIISRQGKTYYVLTVAHNLSQRFVQANKPYGIRTWDRQVHIVQQINDGRGCPLSGDGLPAAVVRFGCRRGDDVQGIDIAIVKFESDRDYAVATLGDADTVNPGDTVYVSGWPDPEQEAIAQPNGQLKCVNAKAPRRQRRLAWGQVTGKISPTIENSGYSIFYTDNTRAGMSGGPVFDSNGRVVGSHGLGSASKPQCGPIKIESRVGLESRDNPSSTTKKLDFSSLNQDYSSSQNVNEFVRLIREKGLNLAFNLNLPAADLIKKGMSSGGIQAIARTIGKVEFDAKSDGFEDPNDVEKDIYENFSSLENRLRDCTGVLVGDSDECARSR